MKLAVTGVTGLLGSTFLEEAKAQAIEAVAIDRSVVQGLPEADVSEYLESLSVNIVIHCAANTNVDFCEGNADAAYNDNVKLTETLARACSKNGLRYVFISSTGIYGDYQDTPYSETDPVRPTTVYHNSKWLAENVMKSLENFTPLIVRTGWLYGGDADLKKNFVANRIREAQQSFGKLHSDTSQKGNPTYALDVVRQIFHLLQHNLSLIHI